MTVTFPDVPFYAGSQLGCAQSYSAAIHWRGGAQVFVPANQIGSALTAVTWDRRLIEVSTGQVVIAKQSLTADCCGLLGSVFPWCHELTIYRESTLVWQGPVSVVTEDQDTLTVAALDIASWLARLVNTHSLNHPTTAVDIVSIARDVITLNLNDSALAVPVKDWPQMLSYLAFTNAGVTIKLNRKSIWTDTVLNIVTNMANKGAEWTTVGRRMVMRAPATSATRARARLTPDDLPGGVQVQRDGTDAATRVFATSQTDTDDGITVTTALNPASAVCGRVDQIVRDQPQVDVETDAQETARHTALQNARDADIKASQDHRDALIKAERTAANADITAINNRPGSTTPADRNDAEARRKLRDDRIDQFRTDSDAEVKQIRRDYEDDLAASDQAIADQQADAVAAVLLTEAKQALKGRWPPPMGIVVQDGAKLAPTADITVAALVPGERIDVATTGYCMNILQAMRLSKVTASWTAGQDSAGESIGISLVPMAELAAVDA